MQTERERILQGFEEMRGILDREEQKELQKLEEDEVNVSELHSDLQPHIPESIESIEMPQVRLGMELPHTRF